MRKLPLLLAVGQLTASIGTARAQSPPRAAAPSPAQHLRDKGSAEANAGRLPEALAAWRAAWALSPDNRSLACDIGRGELLLGPGPAHNVEAAQWMSRCVRLARDGGPRGVERGRAYVLDLAVARSRVAEITLEVEDGAALRLDGESLGAAPLTEPLFVEPGRQYRLEARKGAKVAAVTVNAVAGKEHRVSLALKVEPPPFPEPAAETREVARRSPAPTLAPVTPFVWWPVVAGSALAVAGTGIGAACWSVGSTARDEMEGIQARITKDTRGKVCGKLTNHPECESFGEADRRRSVFLNAATGLFIVGGIAAAATIGFFAYEKNRMSLSITAGGVLGRYVW